MPAEKNVAEFKREDRYIVIKRKDLNTAPFAAMHSFLEHLEALDGLLPARQFLVIESDWPEYEPAWAMIEARVTGQPPALGGEPEVIAYVCHGAPGNAGVMFSYLPIPEGFSRKIDLIDRTHFETLRAENERLRGIQPDFPPRPPDGDGLPRYGLRWNGPQQPLATPMDDGYWTPWHLAEKLQSQLAEMVSAIRTLNYGPRHAQQLPSDDQPTYPQRQDWVEWILELCDDAEATLRPIAP